MGCSLTRYHPASVFLFLVCAIALGMFMRNPAFLIGGYVCACMAYLTVRGLKGWKVVVATLPLIVGIAVLNAVFNAGGETVLFTYFGRAFTIQSFAFGVATGIMFAVMLLWFGCYNHLMTSDKFTYLFGRFAPSLTLVFTMVLRFVPTYQRKLEQIAAARASIGKGASEGTVTERARGASAELSSLVTWALDGAIVTADSMKSRGFGVGADNRTSFASYKLAARDMLFMAATAVLTVCTAACLITGAADTDYFPTFMFPAVSPLYIFGLVAYILLLVLPTLINLEERISWHVSLSRI